MNLTFNDWAVLVGIYCSLLCAGWGFSIWLQKQFNLVYVKLEAVRDVVLSKLEYHERHDDNRFEAVRKDIWELRLRNASLDARMPVTKVKVFEDEEEAVNSKRRG